MKVLVFEMLYPQGHKACNEARLNILGQISDIYLVDDGEYYSQMNLPSNIKRIKVQLSLPSKSKFLKIKKIVPFIKYSPLEFLAYVFYLFRICIASFFIHYDHVILLTARTDVLAIGRFFFRGPISVVHHNDIDELLVKKRYIKAFNTYKNKINHIVIADYIKDGLISKYDVTPSKVYVIHEALINKKTAGDIGWHKKKNLIVGIGQTCDDVILEELIELDRQNTSLFPNKILMRNKKICYDGRNLKIINKFFSREEYDNLLELSKACVIFYPETFQLRYSGVIGDSIEHGLSIYGNDIPVMRFFEGKYPNTCHVIKGARELFDIAQNINIGASILEVEDFVESHTFSFVQEQFQNLLSVNE